MKLLLKYVLSLSPTILCGGIAAIYWHLSQQGKRAQIQGMELTPQFSENIGWIFIFAGGVFTLTALAYSLFADWRAWDDRRALRKSLGEE
jgi:hypothetical protein